MRASGEHIMLWFGLKWYMLLSAAALVAIGLIAAWDWFFWRRLPWLRWKAEQRRQEAANIEINRHRAAALAGHPDSAKKPFPLSAATGASAGA